MFFNDRVLQRHVLINSTVHYPVCQLVRRSVVLPWHPVCVYSLDVCCWQPPLLKNFLSCSASLMNVGPCVTSWRVACPLVTLCGIWQLITIVILLHTLCQLISFVTFWRMSLGVACKDATFWLSSPFSSFLLFFGLGFFLLFLVQPFALPDKERDLHETSEEDDAAPSRRNHEHD